MPDEMDASAAVDSVGAAPEKVIEDCRPMVWIVTVAPATLWDIDVVSEDSSAVPETVGAAGNDTDSG